jgi:high-affinity Fe2+/Pb2+ permease
VLCLSPAGVGAQSSFKAIPLACLAGLVVGLAVGFVIYYGGHSIKDLKIFFIISTVMLFFIAAGQVRVIYVCLSATATTYPQSESSRPFVTDHGLASVA